MSSSWVVPGGPVGESYNGWVRRKGEEESEGIDRRNDVTKRPTK